MCQFFSTIATRDGRLLFTEEDSHETIVARAHLRDTDLHTRHWVRVEVRPQGGGWGPVRVDETSTPAWWDENRAAWEDKVLVLAARVDTARKAYAEAVDTAWKAYAGAVDTAWKAYAEALDTACKAYAEALDTARKAYAEALRRIDGYLPDRRANT